MGVTSASRSAPTISTRASGVVDELIAREAIVERDGHESRLHGRLPDLEDLVAVVEHDGDLVAASESERAERMRELIDAAVPRGPAEARVAEDDRGRVRSVSGVGAGADVHA